MDKNNLIREEGVNVILMMYDIVKFTTYCDFHESRGNLLKVRNLLETVTENANTIVKASEGEPFTFTGDGYICAFPNNNSEKAIDATLAIHNMAKEVRKGFDGGRNPWLKAALYKGPTGFANLDSGIRPIGRAPCKVSRIESLAKPGETLASGSVIESVIGLYDVEKLEGAYLKGIAAQKTIYKVLKKKTS